MKNLRNVFLVLLTLVIGTVFVDKAAAQETGKMDDQPNIIFLMADDQRADAFGFMDNNVITPNLDKLASDGVTFVNAYHVAPICQPSRASVMTGQYLSTHGAGFDRPTNYILTGDEFQNTYPVRLRDQGYFSGFIGKFGFAVGTEKKLINKGFESKKEYMPAQYFDVWSGFPGQGSYFPQQNKFNGYENKSGATHLTEFIGDQAAEFFVEARDSGNPFVLSISFKAPHAPFEPAREFMNMYDDKEIPRRDNDRFKFYKKLPIVVREKSRNAQWYFGRTEDYYGNDVDYRRDWHIEKDSIYQEFIKNYYGLITGVDHAVGRIRSELERLGISDNTVIIYTSDNGFFAGSRQLMGKALLYEESVKAPMIVYDPRREKQKGIQTREGLLSMIDVAPTILDFAGVNIPENYPGKSFVPLVYNEKDQIHDAVYGENNFDNFYPMKSEVQNPEQYQSIRSRFVRTPEFKYIRYHENHPVTEELFKISADSLETNNLIDDEEYTEIAEKLRSKIDAFEDHVVDRRSFPR